MPAVPLPPPIPGDNILPHPPTDPPSDQDVINASEYHNDIYIAFYRGEAQASDYSNAKVYEANVIQAKASAVGPQPWLADAMQNVIADAIRTTLEATLPAAIENALRPFRDQIRDDTATAIEVVRGQIRDDTATAIENALQPIKDDIGVIKHRLSVVATSSALSSNWQAGNGTRILYQQVPFIDGSFPTDHGLPLLQRATDVTALTSRQATQYHRGYFPNTAVPRMFAIRRQNICRAIGVRSESGQLL